MIPSELVHYTIKETALEHILYEKRIRFGFLGNTNDPRETKTWRYPLWIPNDLIGESGDKTLNKLQPYTTKVHEMIDEIMGEWRVFCLTKHSPNSPKRAEPKEFSRGYCHPRLWADYGGNHSGVCLVFNGKKLDQNIRNNLTTEYRIFHGSVEYSNIQAIGAYPIDVSSKSVFTKEAIREHFFRYHKESFLKKTTDWKSEHEYRWLIHGINKEPLYIPIVGALKGVIVGPDFPKVYETTIKMLCKELNIFAGKMEWFNGMPRPDLYGIFSP
jgi:hypothetical protein